MYNIVNGKGKDKYMIIIGKVKNVAQKVEHLTT